VWGRFTSFFRGVVTGENLLDSSVTASIDLASVNTNNDQRDDHIRSADFLDVAKYPTMTYRSTGLREDGGDYLLDGELTLHGVTRPVTLELEVTAADRTHTAAPAPASPPPGRSAGATSASTSPCRWTARRGGLRQDPAPAGRPGRAPRRLSTLSPRNAPHDRRPPLPIGAAGACV